MTYIEDENDVSYDWIIQHNRPTMIEPSRTYTSLVPNQDPFVDITQLREACGLLSDDSYDTQLTTLLNSGLTFIEDHYSRLIRAHTVEHYYHTFNPRMRLIANGRTPRVSYFDGSSWSQVPIIFGLRTTKIDASGRYIIYPIDETEITALNDLIEPTRIQAPVLITVATEAMPATHRDHAKITEAALFFVSREFMSMRDPIEYTSRKTAIYTEMMTMLGVTAQITPRGEQ